MKDTGKRLQGVPIYSDPEVPKDKVYMLHNDFRNGQPERNGMIKETKMSKGKSTLLQKFEELIPEMEAWMENPVGSAFVLFPIKTSRGLYHIKIEPVRKS